MAKKGKVAGAGWLGGLGLAALLMLCPRQSALGAARAMTHWAGTVAPSLFPFLALMPLLTSDEAVGAYRSLFGRLTERLFGLPAAVAPAMIVALLGGSPAGSLAVRSVAARAGINRGELRRLALAMCGFSPAFLLSGIGLGLLGSEAQGWLLLRAQWLTQLSLLMALRPLWRDAREPVLPAEAGERMPPILQAMRTALSIWGYMTLFGALTGAIGALLGEGTAGVLLCALDVPSGAMILPDLALSARGRLMAAAGMIGFGGVCVALQNLNALRGCGVRPREYFCVRLAAALLCPAFALLLSAWEAGELISCVRLAVSAHPFELAGLAAALISMPVLIRMYISFNK